MNGLMLHAGAATCTREEVEAVTTPESTESWTPIPHTALIALVLTNLTALGLRVVSESWGLWQDGMRFFGTMDVVNGSEASDYRIVVGLRNSHDRAFSAGLAMGSRVFVCDNLAFSGEITIARKHTRYIMRDLPGLTNRAVGMLGNLRRTQDERIAAYKTAQLTDGMAHDVLIRALDARVIPNQRIPAVLQEWREPQHDAFEPRTAWSLFNAFTEVMKATNRLELPKRTTALHGLMDQIAGVVVPQARIVEDAEDVEVAVA